MAPSYVFRPMTSADLPLVQRWLLQPHVAEWWHDPETFEFFRAAGKGHLTRMAKVLKAYAQSRGAPTGSNKE